MGSVCEYLKQGHDDLPAYVCIPNYPGWGESVRLPGPYGGFLGRRYDPFFSECDPWLDREMAQDTREAFLWFGQPTISDGTLAEGITLDRLNARQTLLQQFDDQLRRADNHARPSPASTATSSGLQPAHLREAQGRLRPRRRWTRGCATATAGRWSARAP